MLPHHQDSLQNVIQFFQNDPEVLALLFGGSLAHGFGLPSSDIDIMIIVSDENHAERLNTNHTTFFTRDLVTYSEGYVDGKFISQAFLKQVAEKGSEPARFAFKDAQIQFSKIDGLEQLLQAVTRYPVEEKAHRIRQFHAQLEAWHWFTGEAIKHSNRYLLNTAISKLVLFGGRLILAHNEMIYPYHKWFLRVLAQAPKKPEGLMDKIEALLNSPSPETIEPFFNAVKEFQAWEPLPNGWGAQFMADSELTWMDGFSPIDDV